MIVITCKDNHRTCWGGGGADRPNKYHCLDEPIKCHRPSLPSTNDSRNAIKMSIQCLRRLQIGQENCWRPIKAYIELAQRCYKRSNYTTMNKVQWLERRKMYIRHISKLNMVQLIYTHAEALIFSSSHNLS